MSCTIAGEFNAPPTLLITTGKCISYITQINGWYCSTTFGSSTTFTSHVVKPCDVDSAASKHPGRLDRIVTLSKKQIRYDTLHPLKSQARFTLPKITSFALRMHPSLPRSLFVFLAERDSLYCRSLPKARSSEGICERSARPRFSTFLMHTTLLFLNANRAFLLFLASQENFLCFVRKSSYLFQQPRLHALLSLICHVFPFPSSHIDCLRPFLSGNQPWFFVTHLQSLSQIGYPNAACHSVICALIFKKNSIGLLWLLWLL